MDSFTDSINNSKEGLGDIEEFINEDEPVSYTHLDVYKRQKQYRIQKVRFYARMESRSRLIIFLHQQVGQAQMLSLIHISWY